MCGQKFAFNKSCCSKGVEPELKIRAPAPAPDINFLAPAPASKSLWLRLLFQNDLVHENPKNIVLIYVYNSLAQENMSVEPKSEFQAPAPATPSNIFWLRFQSSKIAWAPAPAPQSWFAVYDIR